VQKQKNRLDVLFVKAGQVGFLNDEMEALLYNSLPVYEVEQ
jgi:hypothetical protein